MSIRARCRPVKWLGMRLSIATVKVLIGRKVQVLVEILESEVQSESIEALNQEFEVL